MATGKPVAVAFTADNLEPVARALREQFPQAEITICADNNQYARTDGTVHNRGVIEAEKAAQAVGGKVIAPEFTDNERSRSLVDFNDLHVSRGLDEVKRQMNGQELASALPSVETVKAQEAPALEKTPEKPVEKERKVGRRKSKARIRGCPYELPASHVFQPKNRLAYALGFFRKCDAAHGPFTLDVCATADNAKCERYFSPQEDGLIQPWSGVCWMNPPYGRSISQWLVKANGGSAGGSRPACGLPGSGPDGCGMVA